MIDQVNRISQFTYDSKGNITEEIYPDLNTVKATYNSDAEPLETTNENGGVTSFTYDGDGNNTVIEDPVLWLHHDHLHVAGRFQPLTDANNHTTTYLYDNQDRLYNR